MIMKTIFRNVAILLVFFISSFNSLYSYSFIKDGIYYEIISSADLTVRVTYKNREEHSGGYSGHYYIYYTYTADYSGRVEIPSTVEYGGLTFTVTGIDEHAFEGCSNLFSLSIPSSVTYVGESALRRTGIRQLTIEDSNDRMEIYSYKDEYNGICSPFYGLPLIEIYIGRDLGTSPTTATTRPYINKVTIGKNVTNLKQIDMVINCSQSNEFVCYAVLPPEGNIYGKNKRIIVPLSSVEAYKEKWSPSNNELILPITDVMIFGQTSSSEYQTKMESISKSEIRHIGFYGDSIDESLTEEILMEGLSPNCVFLVPGNVGLECRNTINYENGLSEKIELDSRYTCDIPIETSVQNISISHTPSVWADGNKGWEAITLPFECTNVEASEKGIVSPIMLGSSGNFWLRQYVGSSDDAVYFASTSDGVMKANTPYLIAFPGDKMGKGSLEGQTITFKAKNVTIPVTEVPSIQKNGYTFVGNYDKTADEGGGWTLNAEGSAFVWSEIVGDKPFSGYFKGEAPVAGASALRMSFGQMDNTTGLEQNMADLIDHADEVVYTLDGRKVIAKDLKPGLYIKNHKKMMVR